MNGRDFSHRPTNNMLQSAFFESREPQFPLQFVRLCEYLMHQQNVFIK